MKLQKSSFEFCYYDLYGVKNVLLGSKENELSVDADGPGVKGTNDDENGGL